MNRIYMEKADFSWSQDSVRLFNTPSQTARNIFFFVQEAGYFKTAYPYFTERQNLSSFLLLYTLSGEGRLRYEGKEYALAAGCAFWINCTKHHRYETPCGREWEFLWLHFYGNNALGYYEEFVKDHFQVVALETAAEGSRLEEDMREILSLAKERTATSEVRISKQITALLTDMILAVSVSGKQNILMPAYVRRALKFMDREFKRPVRLEETAAQAGVDKFYLSKEFKKYVGVTVNEYLIRSRLSCAKELLKYTDEAVGEVAYLCGMNHVSHFIELFKAREGMTPGAYREYWKTGPENPKRDRTDQTKADQTKANKQTKAENSN